ncbi:MAG: hypothetical protein ACI358_06745 [Candidatus Limimorpha sp.]
MFDIQAEQCLAALHSEEGWKNNPWTDIVTAQPDGYVVDDNGNVEISFAEGLVWLVSVVNGLNGCVADDFNGREVSLTADVDVSDGGCL